MHNPASILENDTLCIFGIETDHLIFAKTRPYNNQQKEENL